MTSFRVPLCCCGLAWLLAIASVPAYAQPALPAAAIRQEQDTYDRALQYLRGGDQVNAINLINGDALMARLAMIRLLRQPATADLARTFAELFPSSSNSEIELPFLRTYDRSRAEQRQQFLNWMDVAVRAEYIITHQINDKFWTQAVAAAIEDIESARSFFRNEGFLDGEAYCVRLAAVQQFISWDKPSFDEGQRLYTAARGIYESAGNIRGQVLSVTGMAMMNRRAGQVPVMRQYRNEALKLAQSAGDRISEIYVLVSFPAQLTIADKKAAWTDVEQLAGLVSLKYSVLFTLAGKDHDPESKKYFQMIETMLARETELSTAANRYAALADEISHDGNWDYGQEQALPYIDRAIEATRKLPHDNSRAVADLLWQRGAAEMGLLQYTQCESTWLEALETLRRSEDRSDLSGFVEDESWLLLELAQLYERTGDYPRAIETAQQSLARSEEINLPAYIVQGTAVLARVHVQLGDLRLAEEEFLKATRVQTRQSNEAFTDLAKFHLDFGFYPKVLDDLDALDKQFQEERPGAGAASIFLTERLRLLTLTWLRIGDLSKAMEFAKATEGRPPQHTVDIEEGLVGLVWMEMKKYAEAEKYFLDRFATTPSGPRPPSGQADAHKNLGRIYRLENRRAESIEHLTKALELYRSMFRRKDELDLLIELGQVALGGGKLNDARSYLEDALKIAEEGQWPEGIWSVRGALADLARVDKDTERAIEQLKLALNAVETVSARLNSELSRSSFVEDKIGFYDELIRLLGSSRAEEAFAYAERRRAQSFIEGVRRQGLTLTRTTDNDLLRKKAEVEQRLVGKQKALWDQLSKPPAERNRELIAGVNRDLVAIRSEHIDLLRRIQESDPVEASRHGIVTPVTAREAQRDILKSGDALVEYVVTGREIFAFVITPEQIRFVRLPATRDTTARRIQRLMLPFAQLRSQQVDLLHMTFDVTLANQLYKDLLAPLDPYIRGARRLIVVADDVLNYLPFESLARTPSMGQTKTDIRYAEYEGVDWLVKHYTIVYAVSATSLHPRFQRPATEPQTLLAFGNPKLTVAEVKNTASALRGSGIEESLPVLSALPQSAREAATVARLLRSKVRTTVLTAEQARKAEFLRQGSSAGYIHFAVHSVPNEQQPYYSALVLSPDADSDGLLQTYEILDMRLNARLVTLSSCETGLGKLYKGEGLLGLRRAFLVAGAESIVVSFWSIDDSTADFMALFYRGIAQGQHIEDSLRSSKLKYLQQTMTAGSQQISLSHPFFWAPFAFTSTKLR